MIGIVLDNVASCRAHSKNDDFLLLPCTTLQRYCLSVGYRALPVRCTETRGSVLHIFFLDLKRRRASSLSPFFVALRHFFYAVKSVLKLDKHELIKNTVYGLRVISKWLSGAPIVGRHDIKLFQIFTRGPSSIFFPRYRFSSRRILVERSVFILPFAGYISESISEIKRCVCCTSTAVIKYGWMAFVRDARLLVHSARTVST